MTAEDNQQWVRDKIADRGWTEETEAKAVARYLAHVESAHDKFREP